jgi:hypothetical protein
VTFGPHPCTLGRSRLSRMNGNWAKAEGVWVQAGFLILMEEMGSGSETVIRVPHAGQYVLPVCSSTLGTVVNVREQLGHFTLMILTKHGSWLVGFVKFELNFELNNVWIFRKPTTAGLSFLEIAA